MLDLETLGTAPGSAILSIGAVVFGIEDGLGEELHLTIALESCKKNGLTVSAATEQWWMRQSKEAWSAASAGGRPLRTVLAKFDRFWLDSGAERIWGHGANFDQPLLEAAYTAIGWKAPWPYHAARCTRTLYELAGVTPDRSIGTHHNALDDAKAQARAAIEALRRLGHGDASE